jgi:hypothetical protein
MLHLDLLRSSQLDKPFMACIDLGVEPAHMPDFFGIFMNNSMDTANMKGILQVNAFTPLTSHQMADLTPKCMDTVSGARHGKSGADGLRGKFCGAHGVRER